MPSSKLIASAAVLLVKDVVAAANHYRDAYRNAMRDDLLAAAQRVIQRKGFAGLTVRLTSDLLPATWQSRVVRQSNGTYLLSLADYAELVDGGPSPEPVAVPGWRTINSPTCWATRQSMKSIRASA